MRKSLFLVLVVALFAPAFLLAKDKDKDKASLSTVNFLVVRESKGRQKQWGQQLKTNAEGKTQHPAVEYGKVRIQVIAPGYQTYGEDYEIDQETMDIVIKLKLPQEQHSIYK